jgi:uncharacterized protein
MILVVLDTNVLVSAMLSRHGNEAHVLRLVRSGIFRACISQPILEEYELVLPRPEFRLPPSALAELLTYIQTETLMAVPKIKVNASSHKDDNRFLECAETAGADFLVTGNKRHFPTDWKGTKVVNARELLFEAIR